MGNHVYDKVCSKGGCYGSKPLDGPGVPGWAPFAPSSEEEK